MEFYVYYRVKNPDAAMLLTRVKEMQSALAASHGIGAAIKRRPEECDGVQTWMEIYCTVPEDFENVLDRASIRFKLVPLIDGGRHIERFMDIGSCV